MDGWTSLRTNAAVMLLQLLPLSPLHDRLNLSTPIVYVPCTPGDSIAPVGLLDVCYCYYCLLDLSFCHYCTTGVYDPARIVTVHYLRVPLTRSSQIFI